MSSPQSLAPSIVILTGAGISAESGIKTFRDHHGLWENHRVEDVASPEGFARNPALVQAFYNERRKQLRSASVQPNAAHEALARLEAAWPGEFLLVTQNVDDLHERAGSKKIIHMHGELLKARCQQCNQVFAWLSDIAPDSLCPHCGRGATLRPHIVWFGEMPLLMDEIFVSLEFCDLFVAIGTSGQVYPAAGFVRDVPGSARRIEVNLERSSVAADFPEMRIGKASAEVPKLVDELLSSGGSKKI